MKFAVMSDRIRKARMYMGYTQEQLAELSGVSVAHVGHIERGTRVPSLMTLYAICRALNIRMSYVLAGE